MKPFLFPHWWIHMIVCMGQKKHHPPLLYLCFFAVTPVSGLTWLFLSWLISCYHLLPLKTFFVVSLFGWSYFSSSGSAVGCIKIFITVTFFLQAEIKEFCSMKMLHFQHFSFCLRTNIGPVEIFMKKERDLSESQLINSLIRELHHRPWVTFMMKKPWNYSWPGIIFSCL